jgi:Uma2 family endonuclease
MSATAYPDWMLTPVHYPDCDGKRMSDNTLQFDWISLLKWGAEAQYANDPNVFVAGDHLIYPVQGDPKIRQAPDAYVAFGRFKEHRGSYKVWWEAGIFPQVVFEVWSPSNTAEEMDDKFAFYQTYGAEEYYLIYPDFPAHAKGWVRKDQALVEVPDMNGHVSPRLGWRFQVERGAVRVFGPDGREIRTPVVAYEERDAALQAAKAAAAERDAAAVERDAERERAARIAAKLRELGLDPDTV